MRVTDTHDPIDVFADVARALAASADLEQTLEHISRIAVETVPGAEYAAVSLVRGRRDVQTVGATDPLCQAVDRVQYETGQGPCLDAIWEEPTVSVDDLLDTDRWPALAARAATLGIRSMLSFRLFLEDDTLGALNLYAAQPASFSAHSAHLGEVFAAHAAVAWDHAREAEGLQAAILTREVIGQAQGILMAQRQLTSGAAFRLLRTSSQARNVKLREVAAGVVRTGVLPGEE